MKKIIAVNGSPRRKNNTYDVIRACLDGCEEAGAETKLYQLADLKFSGCVSCFYCKNKAIPHGQCAVKDDISPILEEIKECDGLILGSPHILHEYFLTDGGVPGAAVLFQLHL